MKYYYHFLQKQTTLLLLSLCVFMIGCAVFGQRNSNEILENTPKEEIARAVKYLTVKNQPKDLCPRIVKSDRNGQMNPYYFAYQLDTLSNLVCKAAMDINDLVGKNKLFDIDKYNKFVTNSKTHSNRKRYIQYYKSIPVNNTGVDLNFIDEKVFSVIGTYYPNINIDTSGMISKEQAAKIVIENANNLFDLKSKRVFFIGDIIHLTSIILDNLYPQFTYFLLFQDTL